MLKVLLQSRSHETTTISSVKLLEMGIKPFSGLPFWIPECSTLSAYYSIPNTHALAAGLLTRPLSETLSAAADNAWPKDPYAWGGQINRFTEACLAAHARDQASMSVSLANRLFGSR
jgi:hypothetical protein